MRKALLLLSLMLSSHSIFFAASYYPDRPADAAAVYVTPSAFTVHGDGIANDTRALQQAIDTLAKTKREGIVFLSSGQYRLTRTIHI